MTQKQHGHVSDVPMSPEGPVIKQSIFTKRPVGRPEKKASFFYKILKASLECSKPFRHKYPPGRSVFVEKSSKYVQVPKNRPDHPEYDSSRDNKHSVNVFLVQPDFFNLSNAEHPFFRNESNSTDISHV